MPTITPVRKNLSVDRLVKAYYGNQAKPSSWQLFLINNSAIAGATAMGNWDNNTTADATVLSSEVASSNGYSRQAITWAVSGSSPISLSPSVAPQITASGGTITFTHYGIVDNNSNIEILVDAYTANNNAAVTINDGETYTFNISTTFT